MPGNMRNESEIKQMFDDRLREKSDYTKWRRDYFGDISVEDLNEAAAAYARQHPFTMKKHENSAE